MGDVLCRQRLRILLLPRSGHVVDTELLEDRLHVGKGEKSMETRVTWSKTNQNYSFFSGGAVKHKQERKGITVTSFSINYSRHSEMVES